MSGLNLVAISGYRSILDLQFRLKRLNVVCGPNGSGKSNLYKALRLLALTSQGSLAKAIIQEGGMNSILWAGARKDEPVRLRLAAHADQFNYEISLGLPPSSPTDPFLTDPHVKEEFVWTGHPRRRANTYFERSNAGIWVMNKDGERTSYSGQLNRSESILTQVREPHLYPELSVLGRSFQEWRFYDYFRTDPESPLRKAQPSVRTPILSHDGLDLAAALATIGASGNWEDIDESMQAVFPGGQLMIQSKGCERWLEMQLPGIRRPLHVAEFSDGTLRYLCLLAALLSPSPAPVLVLNEPENSLHPDVLPPLSRLIRKASSRSQVWVTTHSKQLGQLLSEDPEARILTMHKVNGETSIVGQGIIVED